MGSGRPTIPQSLEAIALDTNSGARGLLDLEGLEKLVDVINDQDLAIEIWIPEPTLWEWAEHANELASRTSTSFDAARVRLERSGLEVPAAFGYPSSTEQVIDVLEERLQDLYNEALGTEAVRILRLKDHPQSAVEGLKDQILRRGAGRTKSDDGRPVKTGAADSSAWRLLAEEARSLDNIVLVTRDSDAERHFVDSPAPSSSKTSGPYEMDYFSSNQDPSTHAHSSSRQSRTISYRCPKTASPAFPCTARSTPTSPPGAMRATNLSSVSFESQKSTRFMKLRCLAETKPRPRRPT